MASTQKYINIPDFPYPLPAHVRTFRSIWGVTFVREYLRALNLKPSSKHVRQAIESFGRDVPAISLDLVKRAEISLKDRFGRSRQYVFEYSFGTIQSCDAVLPRFNLHPELLHEVCEGTYSAHLDQALSENNIKLWHFTNLLLKTNVPEGQDKTITRVLMGLAWIEAFLNEDNKFAFAFPCSAPAKPIFNGFLTVSQGYQPPIMTATWPRLVEYFNHAINVPSKTLTREAARDKLLNVAYKAPPAEDRLSLLLPKVLKIDERYLTDKKTAIPSMFYSCVDFNRPRLASLSKFASEYTEKAILRNERHHQRANNEWTNFDATHPGFFAPEMHVALSMAEEDEYMKNVSAFYGTSPKTLEKKCTEAQEIAAWIKLEPKEIPEAYRDEYELMLELSKLAGFEPPPYPDAKKVSLYKKPYDNVPTDVLDVLGLMPLDTAMSSSDSVILWRATVRLASKLHGVLGCMPVPVHTEIGFPRIVWVPRLDLDDVKAEVEQFVEWVQPFINDVERYLSHNEVYRAMKDVARELPLYMLSYAATSLLKNIRNGHEKTDDQYDQYMRGFQNRQQLGRSPWTMLKHEAACRRPLSMIYLSGKPSMRLTQEGKSLLLKAGVRAYTKVGDKPGTFTPMESLPRREQRILEEMLNDLTLEIADPDGPTLPFESLTKNAPFKVRSGQFDKFLVKALPALRAFGFHVDLRDSDVIVDAASLVLSVDEGASLSSGGLLSENALSDFQINLAIGKLRMSKAEMDKLLQQAGQLVDVNGQLIFMTKEASERIRRHLEEPAVSTLRLTAWAKLRALLAGKHLDLPIEVSDRLKESLLRLWTSQSLALPEGITADLRPYQHRGFEWLANNVRLGLGSLLADDMGLGKTVQIITLIQHLKNTGDLDAPVLVVAPASLLVNWAREIRRFAPTLRLKLYHGPKRQVHEVLDAPDVMITSYGILSRDIEKLAQLPWRLMVLDEAQAVKNTNTAVTKAARLFPVKQVIAVTGTPVENSLKEYWTVLSIVQPGLLGAKAQFDREFANPIEKGGADSYDALQRFKRITKPFILRRLKTDRSIISDLPEKNIINRYVAITPTQAGLYEKCLKEGMAEVKDAQTPDGQTINMERKGRILALITRLKQCVNSPSQLRKDFSDKPDSGKAEALLELLDECRENGQKALIFTQYTEMGERLTKWINKHFKTDVPFLHGGVSVKERTKLVDRFQKDDKCPLMVLTLKAGGVGLNLTAANVVIHYDLWWNPATENQATDRAYRIGQQKDVLVYRLISVGTFEEKVDQMLAAKRKLANLTVGTGEKWIGDLSDKELEEIFRLDKDF